MLVRMKTHIGGYRNFVEWPDVGETIELPDPEAADLIAAGHAEEATDDEEPKAERKSKAAAQSDGTTGAADGDEPATGDGSGDGTEGHPETVVAGESTKPVAKRARKATKKAAKKRTPRKRR